MPFLVLGFLFCTLSTVLAQEKGFLVLRTNDTLKGNFYITDGPSIIYWESKPTTRETIRISNIKEIVTDRGVYKVFYFDKSPILLEQVVSGKLTLYETLKKLTYSAYSVDGIWFTHSAKQLFIFKDSLLHPISFNRHKRDLRRLLDSDQYKNQLSFFSRFSYNRIPELIKTYNSAELESQKQ